MTKQELRNSVEWEGGVFALFVEYGIDLSELPEETPTEIRQDIETVIASGEAANRIAEWLYPEQ